MAIMTGVINEADRFNAAEASEAQEKFCEKWHYMMFAPHGGWCPRCNGNIYSRSGYSVRDASLHLITHCPFCHFSFCD